MSKAVSEKTVCDWLKRAGVRVPYPVRRITIDVEVGHPPHVYFDCFVNEEIFAFGLDLSQANVVDATKSGDNGE